MSQNSIQVSFFLLLIGVVSTLTFFIFKPYITVLFLAVVFAIVFYPAYRFFVRLGWGESVASLVTVLIIFLAILIPLIFFGILIFQEAHGLYNTLTTGSGTSLVGEKLVYLKEKIHMIAPSLSLDIDIKKYVQGILNIIVQDINVFFSGFLKILLGIFLLGVGIFFFLRDGEKIHKTLLMVSPLDDSYDEGILKKMQIAINSVVKGSLVIAVLQGVLTGIGFLFFGVGSPALWGGVATIASLIPAIGTPIVNIPAVIFLFLNGHIGASAGLLVWSVLVVGLIDNFLRPVLIERDIKIHPMLILLSVLGGISLFGLIGFLAGPIILSLLFALFEIYPLIVKQKTGHLR